MGILLCVSVSALSTLAVGQDNDWATFHGGSGFDVALRNCRTQSGNLVVAGLTDSPNFPTGVGAFQSSVQSIDGFISVFDPSGTTLLHSTYFGGAGFDLITGLDVAPTGEIVVSGYTSSVDFPTTAGAFKEAKGFVFDGFVSKFSADLTTLEYSTYIGDASLGGNDFATDVAVDAAGHLNVCGVTRSPSFIVSSAAFQTTFGGVSDVFVTRINPAGGGASDLVWSSFLGGAGQEGVGSLMPGEAGSVQSPDIAVGADGSVTVSCSTDSADFPTTTGAFNEGPLGGLRDAFVARFAPDGASLEFATLLGGADLEVALTVGLDAMDRVVLSGSTTSDDFPLSPAAFQTVHSQPGTDESWIGILSADGSTLDYGTYLGGGNTDFALCLDVEPSGVIAVGGLTDSDDFPTTAGARQPALAGGTDMFITRLDPSRMGAAQLRYSTFFGGADGDDAWGIEMLADGSVFIAGSTFSEDFPATVGAYNETFGGGVLDAYVATLDLRILGQRYCSPNAPNSTGSPSSISAAGTSFISDGDVTLAATGLPPGVFGIFIGGRNQGLTPMPGGSPGDLCLGGVIARFVAPGEVLLSDAAGTFALAIDPAMLPLPTGVVSAAPGETWHFQAWHRDRVAGAATSNFTDAISIEFE